MRSLRKAESAERATCLPVADALTPAPALWVSWNEHRRTTGLCSAWGVPLHIIHSDRRGVLRWLERAARTVRLLARHKPRILFVPNPSLVLATLATHIRPLFGYYLVVDAHNEGVRPFARTGRLVAWLTRRLLRRADATIVTNDALAVDVVAAGGQPLILPDKLPELPPIGKDRSTETNPVVVVICSFMIDEPVRQIIAAARTLPEVRFVFTGDAKRFTGDAGDLPPNVRLTGYLVEQDFWRMLACADVICDLTLKPDCLVCGAYEALALAKPMVLSDNPATRRIFGSAAVLTGSEADRIAEAVCKAIDQRSELTAAARMLRATYPSSWRRQAATAWDRICAGARIQVRELD